LGGTLPLPFTKSAHASSADTVVPAGAPAEVRKPGSPLVLQSTPSSAWHAAASSATSAAHAAGQPLAFACAHAVAALAPAPAALWLYWMTWSNASLQYAAAYGRLESAT
jgi:hypothetical protein